MPQLTDVKGPNGWKSMDKSYTFFYVYGGLFKMCTHKHSEMRKDEMPYTNMGY